MAHLHTPLRHWWQALLATLFMACALSAQADTKNAGKYFYTTSPNVLTPDVPYLEFQVAFQDYDGINDEVRDMNFYLVFRNKSEKVQIYHYNKGRDAVASGSTLYHSEYGVVNYRGSWEDDEIEKGKYRFYPSTLAFEEGLEAIYIDSGWDIDQKGRVSYRFNKTFDISMPAPALSNEARRPETETVDYRFTEQSVDGKNLLASYLKAGYTLSYNLYTDSSRKQLVLSNKQAKTGEWATIPRSFANDADVTLYPTITLAHTTQISNAKGESCSVQQDFIYKHDDVKLDAIKGPKNLRATTDIWKKRITLAWNRPGNEKESDKWYIYRRRAADSNPPAVVTSLSIYTTTWSDEGSHLDYDTEYEYTVARLPKDWKTDKAPQGISTTIRTGVVRTLPITLTATPGDADIQLTWTHPAIKTTDASAAFRVMYSLNGSNNWEEAAKIALRSTSATEHSYKHTNITNSCDDYTYRIDITQIGTTFSSNEVNAQIKGTSHVSNVHASKGTFPGIVRIIWEAEQYGTSETRYEVFRRPLGSADDWGRAIYSVSGTLTKYIYDDANVSAGAYYEYKITSQTPCATSPQQSGTYLLDDGFCQSTGSIAGQITYGAGSAVEGVRVGLTKNDESDTTPLTYSLRVDDEMGGIIVGNGEAIMAEGKPFTLQLWASPDAGSNQRRTLIDIPQVATLHHSAADDTGHYTPVLTLPYTTADGTQKTEEHALSIPLKIGEYNHLSLSYDGDKTWTVSYVDSPDNIISQSITAQVKPEAPDGIKTIAFGCPISPSSKPYAGYIDDLRMWRHALSPEEILSNYDRILSGQESDLGLYIPIDEGIDTPHRAYDYSYADGIANENHGNIHSGNISSYVPEELQLYGMTDATGNYLIRGVPFSPAGTNYTLRPTMGTHEFSPTVQNRYVSSTSLNHNAVNFSDTSSFLVTGDAFYAGTTIPVEGATLYVDGNACSRDGQLVQTDEQGRYTIEVPIGYHYIEMRMNNHTFEHDGFWPERTDKNIAEKHYFDQPLQNRRFFDTTLVPVTGRVCGGIVQNAVASGCGASINNIGQAELVLTVGTSSLNVTHDELGVSHDAQTRRNFSIPEGIENWMHSSAWVDGGNFEQTSRLHILTDSETGEFSALIPPCNYKVESVRLTGPNPEGITFTDCARLDATQAAVVQTDTITVDGNLRESPYVTAYNLYHRNEAEITLVETGNPDNTMDVHPFGDPSCDVYDPGTDTLENIKLYTIGDDGHVSYTYNYPIYTIGHEYEYKIHAAEHYTNYDNPDEPRVYEDVIANAEVEVTNQFCGEQIIMKESGELNDKLTVNKLTLDKEGNATYRFTAGYPNVTSPHTRSLNIIVKDDGTNIEWSQNGKFQAIVFGGLPTGNNFITQGPSQTYMVVHDPPGTNSSTTFSKGHTFSVTRSHNFKWSAGYTGSKDLYLGLNVTVATGLGMLLVDSKEAKSEINTKEEVGYDYSYQSQKGYTFSNTTAVSTSSSPDFVGAKADVYYGASYNNIYGKMRCVGLYRNAEGGYDISLKEEMGMGDQFATTFAFSQYEILYRVIPQLEEARDNALVYDPKYVAGQPYERKVYEKPLYVTSLRPGDYGYGTLNTDKEVWGDRATDDPTAGPSFIMVLPEDAEDGAVYENEVHNYISYVHQWQDVIRQNEKAKVDAINSGKAENVSIGTGSGYNSSKSLSYSSSSNTSRGVSAAVSAVFKWGYRWNKVGMISTDGTKGSLSNSDGDGESESNSVSFSYSIGLTAPDRLSVDIYDPKISQSELKDDDTFGKDPALLLCSPIFVTRGGVTHHPYQDEERTLFYQPGTVINEATMAQEKPVITVANNHLTGLTPGSKAVFEVHLVNESESNDDVRYNFNLIGNSTSGKPYVSLDGGPFSSTTYTFSPKTDLVRYIVLEQTDLSETVLKAKVALTSTTQNDATSPAGILRDVATLTAEFLPTSSPSTVSSANKVVNTTTGTTLPLTIGGYNREFKDLRGLELFYRYENETSLTPYKHWSLIGESGCEPMPEGTSFNCPIDMSRAITFPDGTYTFIVRSYAGTDGAVISRDSEPFVIVKDTQRPVIVGNPSPNNHILGRNDVISVVFNEDIEKGRINSDNIIVTGRLNGSPIDHATALQFDGSDETPGSNTKFNLCNHDFAGETWMLIHQPEDKACIFSHGVEENGFALIVDHEGHLGLMTNGKPVFSEKTIDFGRWAYLTVNYAEDDSDGGSNATFDVRVATDNGVTTFFDHLPVQRYSVNGPIQIGRRLRGALQELAFWNCQRDPEVSISECHKTKEVFTPGLVAYWPMSEGEGNIVHDYIHAYDLTAPTVSWYSSAPNRALALDGQSHIDCSLQNANFDEASNYTLEAWLRGDKQDATLISVDNGTLKIGTLADGTLAITSANGSVSKVSSTVLDSNWHHVALNMRRNGSTNIYIDGNEAAQFKSDAMPEVNGYNLTIGANRSQHNELVTYAEHFTGDIDEVRIWKGTLTASYIRNNMHTRVDTLMNAGLVLYLPFEETKDGVTSFTTADKGTLHATSTAGGNCTEASSWPALRAIPQLQRLDYDFVATERTITIRLKDEPARLHGNLVQVALRNIYDLNGNVSNNINWNFYNNVLSLGWKEEAVNLFVNEYSDSHNTENATFKNLTSRTLAWYVDDLPEWLEVNTASGLIEPLGTVTLQFTTTSPVPTESVIEAVNLYDSDGICYPLPINLSVYQDEPQWAVSEHNFDSNMTIVAKVLVNGKVSDRENSILAAFCNDEVIGIGQPVYNRRYDTFFVPMTIYGNANIEKRDIKFKFWDAKTGIIYSPLECSAGPIAYASNAFHGSYTEPITFRTTSRMEQQLSIEPAWSWTSLYLDTDGAPMATLLDEVKDGIELVKTQNDGFDMTYIDDDGCYTWTSSHITAQPGAMYMIKSRYKTSASIVGNKADAANTGIEIKGKQWNWIGFISTYPMSIKAALSDIHPADGDIIKSQTQFAIYNGAWDGTLTQLTPGEGYMYRSATNENRTFYYPSIEKANNIDPIHAPRHAPADTHFEPTAPGLFSGNMTLLAALRNADGEPVEVAELAVFAGNECRAVAQNEGGLYYLTIPGETVEPLTFRFFDGTAEHDAQPAETLYYRSNNHYGTPSAPYVVTTADGTEGISSAEADDLRVIAEADRVIATAKRTMQHVDIVSPSGAIIAASTAPATSVTLPTGAIAPGVYYVRVAFANGGSAVKTFIKY